MAIISFDENEVSSVREDLVTTVFEDGAYLVEVVNYETRELEKGTVVDLFLQAVEAAETDNANFVGKVTRVGFMMWVDFQREKLARLLKSAGILSATVDLDALIGKMVNVRLVYREADEFARFDRNEMLQVASAKTWVGKAVPNKRNSASTAKAKTTVVSDLNDSNENNENKGAESPASASDDAVLNDDDIPF